jgi:putative ABC transport system ATP-binding protein
MALIQARGVGRSYVAGKAAVPALNGVDLEIQKGEFVALVGPSGSGKSTLLNVIGGLDRPTQGTITVEGLSIGAASDTDLTRYRRDRIGFIFQSFNLLPTLTAAQNVELPMMMAEVGKTERTQRAQQLLDTVGLAARAHHKPNEMSGGEKQRVAIARALANNPLLLLADEPTGNLDSQSGAAVLELLCGLVRDKGMTLLMVTHDLQIAARAGRSISLRDGKIQTLEPAP